MNTKKFVATLAISAVLLTGCGFKKNAIISVNNEIITQADFNEAYKVVNNNTAPNKQSPLYLIMKDRVTNELIVRKLLDQEIERRNITVTAEEEQNTMRFLIDKYGSKENLQEALRENGISNEKFKKDLTEELKMKKLIDMLGTVNVSKAEMKKYYNENPSKFKYPEKVRASHILISANKKDIETTLRADKRNANLSKEEIDQKVEEQLASQKEKAEKILAQAKANPKNFEKLARENSEDVASGQKGGDLGFFAFEDMVQPFSKAAFALKPNRVSDLVQSDYGYHIIIVKDRTKAGNISFEEAQDEIKQYLIIEKQVKLLENLITQLKNTAKIEYIDKEFEPKNIQFDIKKEIK